MLGTLTAMSGSLAVSVPITCPYQGTLAPYICSWLFPAVVGHEGMYLCCLSVLTEGYGPETCPVSGVLSVPMEVEGPSTRTPFPLTFSLNP